MTNDQLLNSNVEPRVMTAEEILGANSFQPPPQNPPHVERVSIKKILLYSFYACFALYVLYRLFRFFLDLNWFFTHYFLYMSLFFNQINDFYKETRIYFCLVKDKWLNGKSALKTFTMKTIYLIFTYLEFERKNFEDKVVFFSKINFPKSNKRH